VNSWGIHFPTPLIRALPSSHSGGPSKWPASSYRHPVTTCRRSPARPLQPACLPGTRALACQHPSAPAAEPGPSSSSPRRRAGESAGSPAPKNPPNIRSLSAMIRRRAPTPERVLVAAGRMVPARPLPTELAPYRRPERAKGRPGAAGPSPGPGSTRNSGNRASRVRFRPKPRVSGWKPGFPSP
jgi:hypothetical protein